jgi:hypothetical protein
MTIISIIKKYVWTFTGDGVFVGGEDDGVHGARAQQAQICPGRLLIY